MNKADGFATAGLFGAVSASTLAVAIVMLEEEGIGFEAWAPALYPFMDIPALILAIVLANIHEKKQSGGSKAKVNVWKIVKESLRGSALSALLLGLALGLFTKSEPILTSFYEPLFRGFLSILMLIMGMEAYDRIKELRSVAHWYAIYAAIAPLLHGLIAFGLGYIAHLLVGFSPGGVIIFGGHRLVQLRHFRSAYLACRYSIGQSFCLYWSIHQRGHAGGYCRGYSAFYCPRSTCIRSVNRHEPYPGGFIHDIS